MSSETFVTAIFLITAIIAAGVLVNAVFPSIYRASETFVSSSQEMDDRMRTDVAIVNTVMNEDDDIAYIWIKNTGVNPIGEGLIPRFDIYLGKTGEIRRMEYEGEGDNPSQGMWKYHLYDDNSNDLWDRGETLEIVAQSSISVSEGDRITFQIVLPNGVRRNIDFSVV
ncbi:flagellin [Methanocalculus taiwanensis]|uniref:Flagellin n=1 Tax=Methanocalculus taiwanensis TaxID=106207 RepID=A0ABD4TG35_9EURY|nr:flagellin [Methanocalculus taiwanensis]MCQ1537927.1 flagellin [Methanocalculus taiwanensis]